MFETAANFSIKLLGFDVFCLNKKFLVLNLVERNLKIKYRRSFLGFLWTILSPLSMSLIYYFVFKVVLNIQKEHYLSFIICGVLPWNIFAQTITESTESITANAGLLTKIPIPIQVFPYVTSITNFSTLGFSVPVILATSLVTGTPITWNALWLIYFYLVLLLFSYTAGTILSFLYVYLRDLRHAIGLILQLWFYATPVLYASSMIPEKYKFLLYLNPVGQVFDGIHTTFIDGRSPSSHLIFANLAWCLLSLIILRLTYLKLKPGLVERI